MSDNQANSKYSILVIDDEPDILDIISGVITEMGYQVITAHNGQSAFDLVEQHEKNLVFVLSDYKMPDMNGFQLREKLLSKYKAIPFAILSGHVTREMALSAVDHKICAFLDKPANPFDIKDLVGRESKYRQEELDFNAEIRQTFIDEATELVEEVEPLILQFEENPDDMELINGIYRLIHTIKGGSNVLECEQFTKYLHAYEEIFSNLKNGNQNATPDLISVLLEGFDKISGIILAFRENDVSGISFDSLSIEVPGPGQGNNSTIVDDSKQKSVSSKKTTPADSKKKESLSVPMKLLDEFMAQSGEITVIRNMVNKLVVSIAKDAPNNKSINQLSDLLDEMHKINSFMQKKIVEIRKVPISQVVKSVPRTVRDVSKNSGKQVKFSMQGEDIRVDTVISQVFSNCLTHMVRNSVDHGIEAPEVRVQKGKPKEGNLTIRCLEEGEFISLQIEDDGAGIDVSKIKNKAIEKGLISESDIHSISDAEARMLIFAAGFSTAEAVTDISGRGVGMDMVRSSIESINGKIEIDSEIDRGTTFKLKMPIPKSVHIIDSLIIAVGDHHFAIPQENIYRLFVADEDMQLNKIVNLQCAQVIQMDDQLVPIVKADKLLGIENQTGKKTDSEKEFVMVKSESEGIYAIEVDHILDNESIVVKPIERVLKSLNVYHGSTFLGDGAVGLILDIDGLVKLASVGELSNEISEEQEIDSPAALIENRYVAFELDVVGKYAVALENVYRLERLPIDRLQFSGAQQVIRYRNGLLPVIDVSEVLESNSFADSTDQVSRSSEFIDIIVVDYNDKQYGLKISKLNDIHYVTDDINTSINSSDFIKGNIEIDEKIYTVINPLSILEVIGMIKKPEAVPAKPEPIAIKPAVSEQGTKIDFSAGFGVF